MQKDRLDILITDTATNFNPFLSNQVIPYSQFISLVKNEHLLRFNYNIASLLLVII